MSGFMDELKKELAIAAMERHETRRVDEHPGPEPDEFADAPDPSYEIEALVDRRVRGYGRGSRIEDWVKWRWGC